MFRTLWVVPTADPDDARRRQLLNILLASVAAAALVILAATAGGLVTDEPIDRQRIEVMLVSVTASCLALFFVNRYLSGWLASSAFLILLTTAIAFGDTPQQLVNGRSLFDFVIPIIFAGVLLPSVTTFVFAGFGDLVLLILAWDNGLTPNVPALFGFMVIALVSWLSGQGLENALRELRRLNVELETRVQERTRNLREALTRELAEARKNEAILQSIADGVIVFDENGRASVANPAVHGLLERPASRIAGASLEDLLDTVPENDRRRVTVLFQPDAAQGKPEPVTWGNKTLSLSVAPVLTGRDSPAGFVAVFRDITVEVEVSRMKSMIVAMVSHELRTPLSALQGLAEMLEEKVYGDLNARQAQVVERLLFNIRRLNNLVGDLLDRAQIEAGTLKVEAAPFAPSELIRPVEEVIGPLARDKGLALTTEIDPALPATVIGDPHRLSQIMINLAGNAVKFTETGSVRIRLSPQGPNDWAIEVMDTGPGIPISAEAYIFDPFRQVDGSAGRRHGGIGLGLSIVKSLVDVMRGQIRLSSRMGRGTTFTVVLPMGQPSLTSAQKDTA